MERRKFLTICGGTCLVLAGMSVITGTATATPSTLLLGDEETKLPLDKSRFVKRKKGEETLRRYVIIRDTPFDYPIIVYRTDEGTYTALLMRCTHQSNELNANGEMLSCNAHGSEFDMTGQVLTGPAEQRLQAFETTSDETTIYIHIK